MKSTACADIGNTRIKLLVNSCSDKSVADLLYFPWRKDLHGTVNKIIARLKKDKITELPYISVNIEAENVLVGKLGNSEIHGFPVKKFLVQPLLSDYDIGRIGMDRLANINAARNMFRNKNIIVVDSGTALTIEIIKGKHHKGGFILPGEKTLLFSLNKGTSLLPMAERLDKSCVPGKTTIEAIERGVGMFFYNGVKVLLDNLVKKNNVSLVVVTGGNGINVSRLCEISKYVPDLTLHGVMLMAIKKPRSF